MKLLITTGLTLPDISEADVQRIREAAGGLEVVVARSAEEAAAHVPEAEVVFGALGRAEFARAKGLRWLHAIASGVDMLLYPEMVQGDVLLSGEKALVGDHLADHAFALLLALTRQLGRALREGPASWRSRGEMRRQAIELSGLTMGVVGLGGTGRAVARRAEAFGMTAIAVDAEPVPPAPGVDEVWGMERFHDLLRLADVVTICCPLTAATRGLFGAEAFAAMKRSALLVNVTRGAIVDGAALVAALQAGQIAGAGLDVTPEEPLPPDNPLWALPNVVITPHTAGASQRRAGRNIERFVANLHRYRGGQPLEGLIDKAKGY